MSLSFWQLLLVVVLMLLLFGRGRIPTLMSDLASGIKSFKKGLQEDEVATPASSSDVGPSDSPKS